MRSVLARLRYLLGRRQFDADLAEELEFHRAMKQHELEADGQPRDAAIAASRRALGNMALAQDRARDEWIRPWLSEAVASCAWARMRMCWRHGARTPR